MKTKLYFTIALFVFSTFSFAQPTLTDANCGLYAGDIFTVIVAPGVSPGNSGANQTWDLSSINYSATAYVSMVANTASSSIYPSANVAYQEQSTLYEYYKKSTANLQYYGNHIYADSFQGTIVVTYTNPIDYLRFPCNYNDSYVDNFSGTTYRTGGGPPTMITFGTATVTADGYGTLIVPTRTITNVMRVHIHSNNRDSIPNNSWGTYYILDHFLWYAPGTHYPVAGVVPGKSFYITNYPTGLTDIETKEDILDLYPVPTLDKLTVSIETSISDITVYNNLWQKVVFSKQWNISPGKTEIDVSCLPNGVYLMQVEKRNGSVCRKRFMICR